MFPNWKHISLLGRAKIQENPYHQDSLYGNASNHSHKPRLANIHYTLATLGALTLLTLYIYDSGSVSQSVSEVSSLKLVGLR